MRMILGALLLFGVVAEALAEPKCAPYPRSPIPAEVRVQVWSQFLQENPKTEHREKILKEIERALDEMWGKPDCEALLRDATVNPFKDSPEKKSPTPQPKDLKDWTIDPFHAQDGMLVNPFLKRPPLNNPDPLPEDSTYNPFAPNAPKGPKGPKKGTGASILDPFAQPRPETNSEPEAAPMIESDDTLLNPFKKKKNK